MMWPLGCFLSYSCRSCDSHHSCWSPGQAHLTAILSPKKEDCYHSITYAGQDFRRLLVMSNYHKNSWIFRAGRHTDTDRQKNKPLKPTLNFLTEKPQRSKCQAHQLFFPTRGSSVVSSVLVLLLLERLGEPAEGACWILLFSALSIARC